MASLIEGKFIVDGVHWDYFPGDWDRLDREYSVRTATTPTLNLRSIIVSQTSMPDINLPDIEKRLLHRQAWKADWDDQSWMDVCMRDHLWMLYSTQRGFWIQFDDEMSRNSARLRPADANLRSFFTPTYPIFPYGYTPIAPTEYNGTVNVNGTMFWDGFTVNGDLGMVTFQNPMQPNFNVYMRYTWRAYVHIIAFNLLPKGTLSQDAYIGEVVFEQLNMNLTADPWWITIQCGRCPDPAVAPFTGGTAPTTLSGVCNPTWGDTRYSKYSGLSIPTTGSGYSAASGATPVSLTSGVSCPSGFTAVACLVGSELVQTSAGDYILASDVQVGTKLMGFNGNTGWAAQEVYELFGGLMPTADVIYYESDSLTFKKITASLSHKVYTTRGIVEVGNLTTNDKLVIPFQAPVAIKDIQWVGYRLVYGWNCTPDHNFVVNSMLHHNKSTYCVEVKYP